VKGIIGYGFRRRLLPQNGGMRLVYAKTTSIQTGSVPPTLIDPRPTRKLRLGSRESRDNGSDLRRSLLSGGQISGTCPEQLITGKAKASPGIPGALLCRSHARLAFAATQLRDGGAPDLTILGCSLLPEGTLVAIEQEDHTCIVRSHTLHGHDVSGVTDPTVIELESASPGTHHHITLS
jgi:hypothetical protein